MSTIQVRSQGIYHGLPVYDPNIRDLTAIITGANGISGSYMLRVLSQSPQRWSKIYCLSRRPPYMPPGIRLNAASSATSTSTSSSAESVVEHISCDFLKPGDEIAGVLKAHGLADAKNVYVFFFAYLQPAPKDGKGLWSDAHEMVRVNTALLDNFIGGLKGAGIVPRNFMLQTGAKYYGGHHGPTKVPQEETDPRVEYAADPNFYYPQEDSVRAFASSSSSAGSGSTSNWTICMPGPIVGAVPDAAMNVAFPLAVYATVCAALNSRLVWPSDALAWQAPGDMSSAMLNAYMEEWAVLTPAAANQRFNTVDGSAFTWEAFWPRLAGWFGIEWTGPTDDADGRSGEYTVTESQYCPRGYGGKQVVRRRFTTVEWAKREDVQVAWRRLAKEHGLMVKELGDLDVDRVFGFLDGRLCRSAPLMMSTDKARKRGWFGFVDSSESWLEVLEDFARIKMIPPVPKIKRVKASDVLEGKVLCF